MKKAFFIISLAVVFAFACGRVSAQLSANPRSGETLDKVVAIVGDDIITYSDVIGYLSQMAQQDPSVKIDDKDAQKKVLDMLIDEKLIVAKAIEDSIKVTDEEVDQRWDYQIQRLVAKYGSEKRVEDLYGMSLTKMKNDFREDIRKQMLGERMKQKLFGDVKVTAQEVSDFYNKYKDSLPNVPRTIELCHLVRNVNSDAKTKDELLKLAKSVRDTLVNMHGDFADFAKRYSGDPGTASNGGELGWAKRGMFFKEFESAAFQLQKGAISAPVETPFGFHIIQLLDKTGDSIRTRHILFKFGQNQEDIDKVIAELNGYRDSVRAGKDFKELAKKYSDEKETKGFGGVLGQFQDSQVPDNLKDLISKLKDGETTEPLLLSSAPSMSYHIIYRSKTIDEHKAALATDYNQIETLAMNFKQNDLYESWIKGLRKEMYWEIKK